MKRFAAFCYNRVDIKARRCVEVLAAGNSLMHQFWDIMCMRLEK